jgi:hypothetical protein
MTQASGIARNQDLGRASRDSTMEQETGANLSVSREAFPSCLAPDSGKR